MTRRGATLLLTITAGVATVAALAARQAPSRSFQTGTVVSFKNFRPAQAPNYPFVMPPAPQGTSFEVPGFPDNPTFAKTSAASTVYCTLFADVIPFGLGPVYMALNVDSVAAPLPVHPLWIQGLVGDGEHIVSFFFGAWMLRGAPAGDYRVWVTMRSADGAGAQFNDQAGKVQCWEADIPPTQP